VSLSYRRPDGSTVAQMAPTNANGDYNGSLLADRIGTWTAQAHFGGDGARKPADSQACSFTVTQ
jgi:hypothetical protein